MSPGRKLATLAGLSFREKCLVAEAIVFLGVSRIIVLTVPFKHLARWISRMPDTGARDDELVFLVRKTITIAAKNVPWNAVCLPQAMAAKAMLARRGWGSAFHFGAGYDPAGKFIAHAWLAAGDIIVVGAPGIPAVSPLARFG